eukprot:7485464-Alexandrium_andersonii.AAC.1
MPRAQVCAYICTQRRLHAPPPQRRRRRKQSDAEHERQGRNQQPRTKRRKSPQHGRRKKAPAEQPLTLAHVATLAPVAPQTRHGEEGELYITA